MKEELLNVLRKSDTVEEQEFNMQHPIDQREAIDVIKRYKDIIKTIRYKAMQGQMLKNFNYMEVLSSTVYF